MRLILMPVAALSACAGDLPPDAMKPTGAGCVEGGEVAAVLRNDGAGWYAIDDADHAPINVASVATTDEAITVRFTFTASKIHTFIAAPDDALARSSFFTGASVGTSEAKIALARSGKAVSPKRVDTGEHPWSNVWIYGRFTAECQTPSR